MNSIGVSESGCSGPVQSGPVCLLRLHPYAPQYNHVHGGTAPQILNTLHGGKQTTSRPNLL